MKRRWWMLCLALLLVAPAAFAASGPFANPVKNCHPCRLSPGPGQPTFDLTFVFTGAGANRVLSAIDIAPAQGGRTQQFGTGDIAVSDFSSGFQLGDADINFDGFHDLSLMTQLAANNAFALYWVYQPKSRDFAPLRRSGGGAADRDNYLLEVAPNGELYCHVHGSAVDHVDYWYRVSGDRAVAVRKEVQRVEHNVIVATTYDLTTTPNRVVRKVTVGFTGDSPTRTAFLKRLKAAWHRADALYRRGDKKGAMAAMAPLLKNKYPEALVGGSNDSQLAAALNDYGFFLQETGRPADAVDWLQAVVELDPNRVVAYLNLADAQYATGDKIDAKTNYAEYRKRMTAAGKEAHIPPRVAERMR